MNETIEYLTRRGILLPSQHVSTTVFGNSPELSEALIDLIKRGIKRAGSSLLWSFEFENEPIPSVSDCEIVLNHHDQPVVVTRITNVRTLPFQDVPEQYAALEGEGDLSLSYWRSVHWKFFSQECKRIGREPHTTMPVVCNEFEVLHVL
ncbi:ASCH domain-containing protein [Uliginosibacterium paludis]|uniref:ASCH domain-containing protein n=1 Tax=Uliginosibacterium paludis TaxID=1615952 RepID=A0ABV2CN31_9RHOO